MGAWLVMWQLDSKAFFTTSANAQFLNLKFLHLPKSGDKNGVEQKAVGMTSRGRWFAECFLRLLKVVAKFRIPWLKSLFYPLCISPLYPLCICIPSISTWNGWFLRVSYLCPKLREFEITFFDGEKKWCLDPPLGHGGGESGQLAGSWKVGNSGGLWKWGGVQNLLLLGRH